jgi:hypothetical protein
MLGTQMPIKNFFFSILFSSIPNQVIVFATLFFLLWHHGREGITPGTAQRGCGSIHL